MRPQLVHRLLRVLSFLLVFGLVPLALAQPDPRVEARAHYQAGMAKFNAAQYAQAIEEFQAAEQIAPAPMNDYNIALSYERLGDPVAAIKTYRAYLDRLPNATNRAEVEATIRRLEPQAAGAAEAAAAAEAARQADEAAAATRPADPAGAPLPVAAAATGDAELDRVAAIDLAQLRGAAPLPAPTGAATAGAGAGAQPAPGSAGDPPKQASSRPFYKSPVFWVLAAVGVYVIIVLADDNSSSSGSNSRAIQRRLLLPDTAAPSSGAPVLMRF